MSQRTDSNKFYIYEKACLNQYDTKKPVCSSILCKFIFRNKVADDDRPIDDNGLNPTITAQMPPLPTLMVRINLTFESARVHVGVFAARVHRPSSKCMYAFLQLHTQMHIPTTRVSAS